MKQVRYRNVSLAASEQILRTSWNPNVHYRFHNSSTPVPIFSQTNPADIQLPNSYWLYFPSIYKFKYSAKL